MLFFYFSRKSIDFQHDSMHMFMVGLYGIGVVDHISMANCSSSETAALLDTVVAARGEGLHDVFFGDTECGLPFGNVNPGIIGSVGGVRDSGDC